MYQTKASQANKTKAKRKKQILQYYPFVSGLILSSILTSHLYSFFSPFSPSASTSAGTSKIKRIYSAKTFSKNRCYLLYLCLDLLVFGWSPVALACDSLCVCFYGFLFLPYCSWCVSTLSFSFYLTFFFSFFFFPFSRARSLCL